MFRKKFSEGHIAAVLASQGYELSQENNAWWVLRNGEKIVGYSSVEAIGWLVKKDRWWLELK